MKRFIFAAGVAALLIAASSAGQAVGIGYMPMEPSDTGPDAIIKLIAFAIGGIALVYVVGHWLSPPSYTNPS